jgi:membrane protein required for colicin V production
MNAVDLIVGLLLVLGLLRGFWRGFVRESFGVLALLAGVVAAIQGTGRGAAALAEYATLPESVYSGVAFVGIFAIVHSSVNLIGMLFDRAARGAFLRSINRLGGAFVGAGKCAVVVAFALLFLHLFPMLPTVDGRIMGSAIGRSLVSAAGDVLRLSSESAAQPDARSRT